MTKVTTNKPNGIVLDPATYANVVQIYAGVTVTNSGNANAIGQAGATYTFDIQNAGTIQAPDVGAGISLTNGGTVTNLAAGVVAGGAFGGVDIDGAAGTVTNSGTISAAAGHTVGVYLASGGLVTNLGTGSIQGGNYGVWLRGAGTVVNDGNISSTIFNTVYLDAGGGSVTNASTGTISGVYGIVVKNGGTVTNAGTITSSNKYAIFFEGVGANRMILDPGSDITGKVRALSSPTSANTLELASAATAGTLTGWGSKYVGFGQLGVDASAAWTLAGTVNLVSGTTLSNLGSLTVASSLANYGIVNGALNLAAGATLTNKTHGTITQVAGAAVYGSGAGATVTNQGTIIDNGSTSATGVQLNAGGTVRNLSLISAQGGTGAAGIGLVAASYVYNEHGATITSSGYAIYGVDGVSATIHNAGLLNAVGAAYAVRMDNGTVTNSGTITAQSLQATGVDVTSDGTSPNQITNQAGGSIYGSAQGVDLFDGTLLNQGTITGGHARGVYANGVAQVTNAAAATISGATTGVYLHFGGTLDNAGTILGGATAAVFGGFLSNSLVLHPGFSFGTGDVIGSTDTLASDTASNTIELASAASTGTLTGLGSQFTNFTAITFDHGAHWSIAGSAAGLSVPITGFFNGDIIEVTGHTIDNTGLAYDGTTLTFGATGGAVTLDLPTALPLGDFILTANAQGTEITIACFAAGTRLLTAAGEIPVEQLQPGTRVLARDAKGHATLTPIKWIGHRTLAPNRHPTPDDVHPIRVAANAFGPGQPHRDLFLSPDHAVFANNVLIPIRYLANGATIARAPAETVTYFHVELESHAILLADGLPCESYLDTGNRAAFANGGPATHLHPDFAPEDVALSIWREAACACLVVAGPELQAARRALLAEATTLGHATTADPALRLMVNGQELAPEIMGKIHRFHIPAAATIRLRSRAAVPAELQPEATDPRRLGIAVAAITLSGQPIQLTAATLGSGWHAPEPAWRWTDGDAVLHLPEPGLLEIDIALTALYWNDPPATAPAATSSR